MGADVDERESTPDELERMKRCCAPGSRPAASASRRRTARTHNDADGNMVPSRNACDDGAHRAVRASPASSRAPSLEFIPQVGPRSTSGPSS